MGPGFEHIDPNTFRLYGMSLKEIDELYRLRCIYNGIEGMKSALECNHAVKKENEELRNQVITLRKDVEFHKRIINKLTEK